MKSVVEVLKTVLARFSGPDKHTKGAYARTQDGLKTGENDGDAVCWCLDGMVISVSPNPNYKNLASNLGAKTLVFIRNMIEEETGIKQRHEWNDADSTTFAMLTQLLTRAIARAEKLAI